MGYQKQTGNTPTHSAPYSSSRIDEAEDALKQAGYQEYQVKRRGETLLYSSNNQLNNPYPGTKQNTCIDTSGYTYVHEHLHIDLSGAKGSLDCRLDQYDLIVDELRHLYTLGLRNIAEMTNRYMGRNANFLLNLMHDSHINIIASTGYYKEPFFPAHFSELSVQAIADDMIAEIETGIDGTELKAGVIAEIGSSLDQITTDEKKVFAAAALAHHATGCPISTHTTLSTMGREQLALLKEFGVSAAHVAIGHCDLKDNLDTIIPLLEEGAWVQFDTIGKNNYYPDSGRIAMLREVAKRGLLSQVMLSQDITRRSHLKSNGGIGFDYLLTVFVPMLLAADFSQTQIDLMLRDNPAQFFRHGFSKT
ncbi:phosphotriesterase-related protein [Xenorhabdus bovienii]|uniref:phosphotriesterase-related protein n=1 Tax=Xenorhabdus bovienii TaxID=40576 RepID=UPI0004DAB870|nr:phosphotriesterase-related protein [Xenorhabdus bovienii]CDG88224.1 putative phosphotriesterase with metallo-dependent hydrolase domain [Xenorhabdus bovienii str. feltiae France]CDG92433.1 putative phosphotriesterase with metallo-dependent hydrolase domain [Xenorhabdus bovienii str. feltiae Florida]